MSQSINPKLRLNYILNKADDLPCFPLIAIQAYNLCSNPHTKPKDIETLVRTDQALSAKLLRIVNSSYFGYAQEIEDMSQTIAILGLNGIKEIVMVSAMDEVFDSSNAEVLWKNSIEASVAIRHLFDFHEKDIQDQHFLICLMHNIGRSIFANNFMDQYHKIIDLNNIGDILEVEKSVFGMDHRELGGLLAKKWNFPPELVNGIQGNSTAMEDDYLVDLAIKLTYQEKEDLEFDEELVKYSKLKESIVNETLEKIEALSKIS